MFYPFIRIVVVGAVVAALTYPFRFFVIEPHEMHLRCTAEESLMCLLRQGAIFGIDRNLFGILSVAFGLIALLARVRILGYAAVALGVAGALLYRIEFAGMGLLLGALALARSPLDPQHAPREQRT